MGRQTVGDVGAVWSDCHILLGSDSVTLRVGFSLVQVLLWRVPAISLMLLFTEQFALAGLPALPKLAPVSAEAAHVESGTQPQMVSQLPATPSGGVTFNQAQALTVGAESGEVAGDDDGQQAVDESAATRDANGEETNGEPKSPLQQADTLVREEKFKEALRLLRQLRAAEPGNADVLTLLGFSAARLSQLPDTSDAERRRLLDEAIAAYHRILVDRPEQLHARLELATMFFLKRQDGLARKHFLRALAAPPSRVLSAQIIGFLRLIEERKRWQVSYGVALAPDTNLNSSSYEDTVRVWGLPFKRSDEALPKSGVGVSTWGGAEYQHPLSPRWRLRNAASVAITEYEDRDFDRASLYARVGPRWLVGTGDISLLAAGRIQWQGGEHLLNAYGVELEVGQRLSRRLRGYIHASWYQHEYIDRSWLTGPSHDYRVGLNLLVSPRLLLTFVSGLSWSVPDSVGYRNYSPWSRVGINVALPRGFTVGTSAEVRWADYEGSWFPYNARGVFREDRTTTLRASVHNRRLTVFGFSPQVVVTHTSRGSNAQAFDYVRTRGELLFVRQF